MEIQKPNLFKIATKELSQDAFLTWLLQWSDPHFYKINRELQECGYSLLKLLVGSLLEQPTNTVLRVKAGRQWEGIDIWAKIYCENNQNILLIVEDKTFTSEHSGQLDRYKNNALKWCRDNDFELVCSFIKIGSEPQKVLKKITEKGFRVFDRNHLLNCLHSYKGINNSIINDFIDHLQSLEYAHQSFTFLPLKNWHGFSWVGFFQFVESRIDIHTWHFVNNPSGGFWNLCLTWRHWNDFPVYIQIEEHKICYKIALSEDETGLDIGKTKINEVQDFVHKLLMEYCDTNSFNDVKKPYPFVHRGNYRTIGVIEKDKWLDNGTGLLDKNWVLQNLNEQIQFYNSFIDHLRKHTYEMSGLSIQ